MCVSSFLPKRPCLLFSNYINHVALKAGLSFFIYRLLKAKLSKTLPNSCCRLAIKTPSGNHAIKHLIFLRIFNTTLSLSGPLHQQEAVVQITRLGHLFATYSAVLPSRKTTFLFDLARQVRAERCKARTCKLSINEYFDFPSGKRVFFINSFF